ncbi:ATP-binding protein [Coleofasciculus sp. E1-EBD-02]|uniref:ATP-binding protein n=1 Tax=Coleofasciculus sp. E1-EBD-02 TaxID=3068481 RepID=UPI00330537C6
MVVFVRDNGIEIAPRRSRQISQIFQRLYSKQEYPGMEIGLTLCQTRVDNHRGRLWVESQLGQDSTFYLTFADYQN